MKCSIPTCVKESEPEVSLCIDHLLRNAIKKYVNDWRREFPECLYPDACQAKAHNRGDPITPDYRHCELCKLKRP